LVQPAQATRQTAAAAEDADPAAASSSDESDDEPEAAQPPPPPPAPLSAIDFWGEVTRLGAQYRFGEWVKVAELVMVMVPGSVEDERMFSTFNTSVNSSATGYKRGT